VAGLGATEALLGPAEYLPRKAYENKFGYPGRGVTKKGRGRGRRRKEGRGGGRRGGIGKRAGS